MSVKKLNSMRFLEQNKIPYAIFEFPDTIHDAEQVAREVDIPVEHVYKTLVVMPEDKSTKNRPMLVLMQAGRFLDLKKMASAADLKKVRMATYQEAEQLTGLKVGGISPLALVAKNWQVYIDQRVLEREWILLSAGQRGVNLKVDREALTKLLNIRVVDCSRETEEA